MSIKVLSHGVHPRRVVDPFGGFPCECVEVVVHITNGESLGDDLVECTNCGIVVTLRELYKGLTPPLVTNLDM